MFRDNNNWREGNSNSVTSNFCLHISRNTKLIVFSFLFTFMKQLKPIRYENYREKDQERLRGLVPPQNKKN